MPMPFIAERPADLADRETLLSMSRLDFMRGVHDGRLAGPPIARMLGFTLHLVEPGRVVFRGRPDFAHANPTGVAQGEIRGLDDGRLYATGTTTCLIMSGG